MTVLYVVSLYKRYCAEKYVRCLDLYRCEIQASAKCKNQRFVKMKATRKPFPNEYTVVGNFYHSGVGLLFSMRFFSKAPKK